MAVKILLVTATIAEAECLKKIEGIKTTPDRILLGKCEISFLITGVGSMATSWELTKWLSVNPKPDLAVNIGIAGSYKENIQIGDVVVPVTDCFADAGFGSGRNFLTLAEAGLEDPEKFPFKGGKIRSENRYLSLALKQLMPVDAITVNTATGSRETIDRLLKKYNPDIETMEGATFFYICSRENLPFLAIRSISNRVEIRNKDNWNIPLALDKLSEKMEDFLLMIE